MAADPCRLPIKLDSTSNGEFAPVPLPPATTTATARTPIPTAPCAPSAAGVRIRFRSPFAAWAAISVAVFRERRVPRHPMMGLE